MIYLVLKFHVCLEVVGTLWNLTKKSHRKPLPWIKQHLHPPISARYQSYRGRGTYEYTSIEHEDEILAKHLGNPKVGGGNSNIFGIFTPEPWGDDPI